MAGWRACPQGPELDLPGMARGPLIQGRSWYGARRGGSTGKLNRSASALGDNVKSFRTGPLSSSLTGIEGIWRARRQA
jgi:hypothetical protein